MTPSTLAGRDFRLRYNIDGTRKQCCIFILPRPMTGKELERFDEEYRLKNWMPIAEKSKFGPPGRSRRDDQRRTLAR